MVLQQMLFVPAPPQARLCVRFFFQESQKTIVDVKYHNIPIFSTQ
jgi:hypothetical protein